MIFLEINDWQFTARTEQGGVLYKQTAGASTASGKLTFGDAANQYSRSHPQQFNNKYLYSLAAEPIAGDLKPAKNHADLIYHHLLQLNLPEDEPIALCVSGHLTNQQLGLLLGIAQEAKLSVSGFLDHALGHSLSLPASQDYHVLDLELHRLVVSQVSVSDNERTVGPSNTFDGMGAANIIDGWMNVIADEFVQKTRFDPLHAGESEQQLFNQVLSWTGTSQLTDQRISVTYADASRDIEVGASLLKEKLHQRLLACEFDHIRHLVMSPRAAQLPGLQFELQKRVPIVSVAHEADLAPNYTTLAQNLSSNSVRRIISANVTAPVPTTTKQVLASHLLSEHHAVPLNAEAFAAHIDPDQAKTRSLKIAVNGIVAPDQVLCVGDRVDLAGKTYTAILVT